MSFGRDTKSRWSLLSGVYARGSKRSHTGGKCVTCSGLSNSREGQLCSDKTDTLCKAAYYTQMQTYFYCYKLLHMQNNNEFTLTLATHKAINVLYFYHISSTYNMRKVANVNKQYLGIYMLLNTIGLSVMVRQWHSIIT